MTEADQKPKKALLVIDVQNDFCPPDGALAVPGGRDIAPFINSLLDQPDWTIKIATHDSHSPRHISFASQHPGARPYDSTYTIRNPKNPQETQTTVLWPDHCILGTRGFHLIEELNTNPVDGYIYKGENDDVESYSAFGPPFKNPPFEKTELEKILKEKGIQEVVCVGIAYDFCVKCTAIDAAELGFKTTVLEEGCKAVRQDEESLAKLREEYEAKGVTVVRRSR